MKLKGIKSVTIGMLLIMGGGITSAFFGAETEEFFLKTDSVPSPTLLSIESFDSLGTDENERYLHLTEHDFQLVAEELNVEVATIKAVVEIEAGKAMKGFWAPGIPVINFDRSMYLKYRNKVSDTNGAKGESVPEGLTGYALKEWKELITARKTNAQGANMGTFWGMFQIGGFNYKLCGCNSVDEFVKRMAYSELEQLQLFAVFITNTGMVESLRKKNWSAFARRYNGPSYASRGYHTKMAKAYARYSKI
ncbi:MAG: N-acetylmuramidase family protein [Muribaculaceae bacterium]|nr:N-acetylmuramidase family protein [Muribaculaceae bacterium]